MKDVILDAGPLISALDARDKHHAWVARQWRRIEPPLLTCEPVLTEVCFLLNRSGQSSDPIFTLLRQGAIALAFSLREQAAQVDALIRKYADVPASLADACLIRMAELHSRSRIFTLDSDFRIYRMKKRQTIPLIFPD
jgi:predicted nucleic acid-binding protein